MPFADAPKTKALLARLDGIDLQSHWDVLRALQKQNLTRMEANDRMQEVCLEAIKAHPWKFLDSRLRRFAWFWITPNGTRRPQTPDFHMYEDRPEETLILENSLVAGDYVRPGPLALGRLLSRRQAELALASESVALFVCGRSDGLWSWSPCFAIAGNVRLR